MNYSEALQFEKIYWEDRDERRQLSPNKTARITTVMIGSGNGGMV
jgi:hypothetical protein